MKSEHTINIEFDVKGVKPLEHFVRRVNKALSIEILMLHGNVLSYRTKKGTIDTIEDVYMDEHKVTHLGKYMHLPQTLTYKVRTVLHYALMAQGMSHMAVICQGQTDTSIRVYA